MILILRVAREHCAPACGLCRLFSSVAKNEFIVRHAPLGSLSIDIDDNHTTLIEYREGRSWPGVWEDGITGRERWRGVSQAIDIMWADKETERAPVGH